MRNRGHPDRFGSWSGFDGTAASLLHLDLGKTSATLSCSEAVSKQGGETREVKTVAGRAGPGNVRFCRGADCGLALTVGPAHAKAASPVLEFVAPGTAFPVGFTADGGPVTAELAGFDSVVHVPIP